MEAREVVGHRADAECQGSGQKSYQCFPILPQVSDHIPDFVLDVGTVPKKPKIEEDRKRQNDLSAIAKRKGEKQIPAKSGRGLTSVK